MPLFIPEYNLLPIHKLMLSDKIRTHTYCEAIAEKTSKDSTVIDLGSGTGILSLAAAKAGAKKVVAVDRARISKVSEKIFHDNGFDKIIQVINQDIENTTINEKFDLLVSEWMGVHVFQENMLPAFIKTRDNYLKDDGKIIPERVELMLAPLRNNPIQQEEIEIWKNPIEDFNLSEISNLSRNDVYIYPVSQNDLTHSGLKIQEIDLSKIKPFCCLKMSAEYVFHEPDKIQGMCGWFTARLSEDILLDTSPKANLTHWQQTIYPCYPEMIVDSNDILGVELSIEPFNDYVHISWTLELKNKGVYRRFSTKNNYAYPLGSEFKEI